MVAGNFRNRSDGVHGTYPPKPGGDLLVWSFLDEPREPPAGPPLLALVGGGALSLLVLLGLGLGWRRRRRKPSSDRLLESLAGTRRPDRYAAPTAAAADTPAADARWTR